MIRIRKARNWQADYLLLALTIVFLVLVLGSAFGTLVKHASEQDFLNILHSSYIQRVLTFTIWQAVLSTILSLALALPLTRFFFYQRFPGRKAILTYFGLCLVMPAIIVILGMIQIHGNSGFINWFIKGFNPNPDGYLYGLTGILLAHVFFNTPLAVRAMLSRLESIPEEQWRIGAQLNFSSWQRFKIIELPALLSALPGVAALILMLCFTSFAIILTLGGGPKATTLEVAIYQALHFDYNLGRAVTLSGLQIAICTILTFILVKFGRQTDSELSYTASDFDVERLVPNANPNAAIFGWVFLLVAVLLVFPPLISVIVKGIASFQLDYITKTNLLRSVTTSVTVAISAGLIASCLGVFLCLGLRRIKNSNLRSAIETLGSIILVFSPFALATGLFLILFQYVGIHQIGPYLIVLINALMSLPFTLRILMPAFQQRFQETDLLCQNLGLEGWDRFKQIDFPLLRKPIGLATAYGATLSIGDFGIVALFGSEEFLTLPLYIYRAMGAYRMDEAAFVSVVLVAISFILFILLERLIGGKKEKSA